MGNSACFPVHGFRVQPSARLSVTGGAETRERVRRLSPDECVTLCALILVRNAGTRRRQLALLPKNGGKGPSTKPLEQSSAIAERCPELFWALFDNSRCGSWCWPRLVFVYPCWSAGRGPLVMVWWAVHTKRAFSVVFCR